MASSGRGNFKQLPDASLSDRSAYMRVVIKAHTQSDTVVRPRLVELRCFGAWADVGGRGNRTPSLMAFRPGCAVRVCSSPLGHLDSGTRRRYVSQNESFAGSPNCIQQPPPPCHVPDCEMQFQQSKQSKVVQRSAPKALENSSSYFTPKPLKNPIALEAVF